MRPSGALGKNLERSGVFASFLFPVLVISLLSATSCGRNIADQSAPDTVKSGGASVSLSWPEGYSYNPETREIGIPGGAPGASLATLPAYITGITLSATNGDITATWDVPLDTMTVEFALPPGEWTFTLTVSTNIPGLSFGDSVTVTLVAGGDVNLDFSLDVNAPPSAGGLSGPSSTYKRTAAPFSISASDLDPDDVLTYSWDGGGGAISGSGASVTWSADRKGSYTVCVTVSDGHGGSQRECAGITVINRNPVIRSVTISNPSPTAGQSVTASADGYDPDGDRVTYTWTDDPSSSARASGSSKGWNPAVAAGAGGGGGGGSSGSGSAGGTGWTDTGQEVTYTPSGSGSATLTVTADDGDGGHVSASASMSVSPARYQTSISRTLTGGDKDFWEITTPNGNNIDVTCTPAAAMQMEIQVFGSVLNQLATGGAPGASASMSFTSDAGLLSFYAKDDSLGCTSPGVYPYGCTFTSDQPITPMWMSKLASDACP